MAFGVGTVLTNAGKAIAVKKIAEESQDPPVYLGIGTGATGADRTADATDTALSTEVESRVGTNSATSETTTVTDDTWQCVQTITATGSRAVDEAGFFDASSSGNMFLSATFNVINLSTDDSLQITGQVQLT